LYRAKVLSRDCAEVEGGPQLGLPPGAPEDEGAEIGLLLRPERARRLVSTNAPNAADIALPSTVNEIVYLGETVKYRLKADAGLDVVVRWPFRSSSDSLELGDRVIVGWDRGDMHWIHWS
jgi:putative spermidine/putrescine transport system ATP-binding protein